MDHHFTQRADLPALTTELQAQSVTVEEIYGNEVEFWMRTSGATRAKVEGIVAAHNPDAAAQRLAAERANEATLIGRAETALTQLKQGTNAIQNGNLFADRSANERAYLVLLGQSLGALIRLQLHRFDSTD